MRRSDPIGLYEGINTYSYAKNGLVGKSSHPPCLVIRAIARAAAMVICGKIKGCKEAVEQAIKRCENIACR
jgi:hypothetical protein